MRVLIILGLVVFFMILVVAVPREEMLTELYFVEHGSLRQNIFPNKSYEFSFGVRNLEGKDMAYKYEAYAIVNGSSMAFDKGAFFLRDGERRIFHERYSLERGFDRARISVKIEKMLNPVQKIFLWKDEHYANKLEIYFWVDEIVPIRIRKI